MADEKGTGKHPHKSSEEPYPHYESGRSGRSHEPERRNEQRTAPSSEKDNLREREYRDSHGQEHDHTRTYEEEHKK